MKVAMKTVSQATIVLVGREAEMLKSLVQNPPIPEDARDTPFAAFCAELFEALKEAGVR